MSLGTNKTNLIHIIYSERAKRGQPYPRGLRRLLVADLEQKAMDEILMNRMVVHKTPDGGYLAELDGGETTMSGSTHEEARQNLLDMVRR